MKRSVIIAALLAAAANFFWAANAIVGKAAVALIPAFTLSQFRWLIAFAILAPFGIPLIKSQWTWYRARLPILFCLSLLSVAFYNTFQYWALEYTQPVNVGAMLALMPLAIATASSFFGGRKQSPLEWLTIVVAVLGALIVVTNGSLMDLFKGDDAGTGELLMIIAISSWALYSVLLKKMSADKVNIVGLLTFFVGVGCFMILPFWMSDIIHREVWIPTGSMWYSVLFVAIFPSIVSYLCWAKAIQLGDATIAGLMVTTAPLFNALLSMIFLDATVSATQWLGIVVVMVGVISTLLISRWKSLAKLN